MCRQTSLKCGWIPLSLNENLKFDAVFRLSPQSSSALNVIVAPKTAGLLSVMLIRHPSKKAAPVTTSCTNLLSRNNSISVDCKNEGNKSFILKWEYYFKKLKCHAFRFLMQETRMSHLLTWCAQKHKESVSSSTHDGIPVFKLDAHNRKIFRET